MKHLKKFNENIIDYKTENIEKFSRELMAKFPSEQHTPFGGGRPPFGGGGRPPMIPMAEFKRLAQENDIEVVNYNEFFRDLPEDQKETAPPRFDPAKRVGSPVFALVNPVTKKQRIVLCVPMVDPQIAEMTVHMLKHETVHVGQHSKRVGYEKLLPDPKNDKEYFSDTDEVMAYSQSIVDLLINKDRVKSVEEGIKELKFNDLWRKIKGSVDKATLNKYKKYVYLYLEQEFGVKSGKMGRPEEVKPKDDDFGFNLFKGKTAKKVDPKSKAALMAKLNKKK